MPLFNRLRRSLFALAKRVHYYLFGVKLRRDYSIRSLRKRIRTAGVVIQPVTPIQWKAIKKRFRGFRVRKSWFDFYNTAYINQHPQDSYDVTKVVPGPVYFPYIDPAFSHPSAAKTTSDKNFTDLLFPDVRRPRTIVRFQGDLFMDSNYMVISKAEAYESIQKERKVIIKPSASSGGGHRIVFWDAESDSIHKLDELFVSGRHYVVQEILKQHMLMNYIYAGSINTIRMETLIFKNEVRLISCMVRMGANGSKVDNLSSGGMSCGVNVNDGRLSSRAYDFRNLGVTYDKHPQGGTFDGFVIPNWEKCVATVKRIAPRCARVAKLIGWDFAIAEDGEPVLIECNMMDSGCASLQLDNGPLFGDLTDEVLEYVRTHKRKRM